MTKSSQCTCMWVLVRWFVRTTHYHPIETLKIKSIFLFDLFWYWWFIVGVRFKTVEHIQHTNTLTKKHFISRCVCVCVTPKMSKCISINGNSDDVNPNWEHIKKLLISCFDRWQSNMQNARLSDIYSIQEYWPLGDDVLCSCCCCYRRSSLLE